MGSEKNRKKIMIDMEVKFQTIFRHKSDITIYSGDKTKSVALLYGGMSAEREVSISSSQGTLKSLIALGYKVIAIDVGADLAKILMDQKPNIVFNCLHGTYGEDGCIPGMLNMMHIPYTHSGLLASAMWFNKEKSREFFLTHNIKCARSILVNKSDHFKTDPMPRPYVIKPLTQGSSIGIKIIFEDTDFNFADYDFEYGDRILVEEYVKGREIQVAILNGKALGTLEVIPTERSFYDYDTKYKDGLAKHETPANISPEVEKQAMEISEYIFNHTGCNGVGRAEFLLNDEDELFILELNTHPGFTPLSIVPEIAQKVAGIPFEQLVQEILQTAKYEK
jgi:D-alanine-D-alanine ligase